jgi:hypothetical protein
MTLVQVKRPDFGVANLLDPEGDGPWRPFARDGGKNPKLLALVRVGWVLGSVGDEEEDGFIHNQGEFVVAFAAGEGQISATIA